MDPMRDPTALLQTLVDTHRHLALDTDQDPSAQPDGPSPRALAYAGARRLGFIPADAACIATAWQNQSDREGHFDPTRWPVAGNDFELPTPPQARTFAACPKDLGLYAVLPDATWVGRIARAGVPTVQLRFKHPDPAAVEAEVHAAVAAVAGTDSLLFINDHWRVAIAAGAYGVHLGQEDLDTLTADEIDTLRTSGLRLGLSTHGYAEMRKAEAVGPSYMALGAVYPTTLKAMATPPQGPARLAAYAHLMAHRPLVAIGGISAEQFPAVAASGVGSVAMVRAITAAPDPEAAAAALMDLWDTCQAPAAEEN